MPHALDRLAVRVASLLAALLAASCGADTRPDLQVRALGVLVETSAPFTRADDFPARLETTLDAGLRYWGGGWDDLAGVSLTLTDAPSVQCGGRASLGCFDGDLRVTTADPGLGTFDCVEQTVLVHEVGHAVIGDPTHSDPRWMDLVAVEEALSGRVGYSGDGVTACQIYPSVWRHPLGQ
jgi:hypothetical protein